VHRQPERIIHKPLEAISDDELPEQVAVRETWRSALTGSTAPSAVATPLADHDAARHASMASPRAPRIALVVKLGVPRRELGDTPDG